MKNIALIGSTGSIGTQVIEVVFAHPEKFNIVAMSAESNYALFERQINAIRPEYACLKDREACKKITEIPQKTALSCGENGAKAIAEYPSADVVFVACSGFAGLEYAFTALKAGKRVALANKETLVCGGDLIMPLAPRDGIVPVDSEHSAIWQCLNFKTDAKLKSLIITASGGALRNLSKEELKYVTPEQALNHPTWKMGKKITIDSATMLNKGYEIIEAHHLYQTPYERIKAVIHPQSIVHSMVSFDDGCVLAQMSNPSMKLPIQIALTYPERLATDLKELNFESAFSLDFAPLDACKYPLFALALECGKVGGIMPTVLNAVSEVADRAFIDGRIKFTDIYSVAQNVVDCTSFEKVSDYERLAEIDALSRLAAEKIIKGKL